MNDPAAGLYGSWSLLVKRPLLALRHSRLPTLEFASGLLTQTSLSVRADYSNTILTTRAVDLRGFETTGLARPSFLLRAEITYFIK